MSTWIAFLRGIGGGIRPLPMQQLRETLEEAGLTHVRTYIQTGNVVFTATRTSAAKLMKRIDDAVSQRFGFAARTIVMSVADLEAAVAANPFPDAAANPKSVHLFFLWEAAGKAELDRMHELKVGQEDFALTSKVFYLYTPDSFGTSKLAEKAGRLLHVEATARNWRTVNNVLELARTARTSS